jgi:hypothetical protein
VKGIQRDLVVQLWSNHGPALQVGVRRSSELVGGASPDEHEALIGCDQLGQEESGSSLPLSGTPELPSDRPTGAHSAELTQPPASEHRRLCEVGHGLMDTDMRTYTVLHRELVLAKSSTSRWIASRSRKLSARLCPED